LNNNKHLQASNNNEQGKKAKGKKNKIDLPIKCINYMINIQSQQKGFILKCGAITRLWIKHMFNIEAYKLCMENSRKLWGVSFLKITKYCPF
jgi:hypothetical protein